MESLQTTFIDLPCGRIRYADSGGDKECVLFLHGFPETLQGWRKNFDAAAVRFRALAPDLIGFGRSSLAWDDFSCIGLAEFVHSFLQRLGIQRAHLVGGDSGLLVALAFAARFPQHTGKLLLFSGTAYPEGISAPDVRLMMLPLVGELTFLPFAGLGLRAGIRRGFFDPRHLDRETLEEYVLCLSSLKARRAALRLMRELARGAEETLAALRQKTTPALLLWAEHERYFYPWVPERLQRDLPGLQLEYVPGCGHFIQEERPELFNERLLSFF